MKHKLHLIALLLVSLLSTTLMATEEDDQVHQAATILNRFRSMPEGQIPRHIMRDAKGLAILSVVKGGFIFSGKYGKGVVVTRSGKGWAGPSFIRTTGIGFGPQVGGQVTDVVLVLNTKEAVRAFTSGTTAQLGGALSVAAGPIGRAAEAGVTDRAAIYAYSLNKGLFAGASLEGTVITARDDANARYYKQQVTPASILSGKVSSPRRSSELIASL
ncbi:MAG: hypothetical protein JWO89_526 [Verrucomicrobiaceae bacterium]|nr:hypothetical protein [Verrucomicrobiaceae bacterium]